MPEKMTASPALVNEMSEVTLLVAWGEEEYG